MKSVKKVTKNDVQIRNSKKSVKRNLQEEDLCTSNKKRKIEESILTNKIETDTKLLELKQKDFVKTKVKDIRNVKSANSSFNKCTEWTTVDYIQEVNNVDKSIAENIVRLFKEDNTIPFIARYRRNLTGSMTPDQLRTLKDSYEQVKIIKHRAATIIKTIDKLEKWSPEIHSAVTSAKSLHDLEEIYSLYKTASKRLVDKAMELGLDPVSNAILHNQKIPSLESLIDEQKEGLRNKTEVINNIACLTAHTINKNKQIIDRVSFLRKRFSIEIHTTLNKTNVTKDTINSVSNEKYKKYFDYKNNERNIQSHQVLAINRAESQKILKVKMIVPASFEQQFKNYCFSLYARKNMTHLHQHLLKESIDYTYKKIIEPKIKRCVRNELKEKAETASIEVFATNVKQLLLTAPVRGQVILGIDPGFHHGCKLAVVSEHGNVLKTAVIYPHKNSSNSTDTLVRLVNEYKCTVLALGDGTAYREMEQFLTQIINSKAFELEVTYAIVNESGASIYSCSSEAKSEFPDLDINLVSAVSIARRLQDPLAELVKVEPKHLGVGMYQHDLPEKQLLNTLNEVVTEAVSFVGVDINTASECLLRRIAGLTKTKATHIIKWRTDHGSFKNRKQLLNVKGIGSKTFEQCAGFIRILPETAVDNKKAAKTVKNNSDKSDNLNPLDQTWIHPESYAIAEKFIKYCQCKLSDLGTSKFIKRINSYAAEGCAKLAAQIDTTESIMEIIIEALTMKKDEDIRLKSSGPLFRNNIRSIDDLSVGTVLNGVVRNITHFGAFTDIGVGKNGLIHHTQMKNQTLCVGQRVEVKIINIESSSNRINLQIVKTL